MKISVIICTLDRRRILSETIPSIKRSSLIDELIIVEGLKPVGYSRDVGWRKARNQIVCFIDDDEVIPEGWFERLTEQFRDPDVGAVWSTLKPLNRGKVNELECLLQNHTLKSLALQARFLRKRVLEDIGGYEHTIGGETVSAALKMVQHGWKIRIVDYPFLHKMHRNAHEWILNIFDTGRMRIREMQERRELLSRFKRALGSFLRGFQLGICYNEPLLLAFYPLRSWLYLIGAIHGSFRMSETKHANPDD